MGFGKRFVVLALLLALGAVVPADASTLHPFAPAGKPKAKYCTRHKHPRGCVRVPKAAKRPRKRDEQGPESLTSPNVENGGGVGGGPGDHRQAALDWALSQRGLGKWAWRCERFVEEAYGTRRKFASAKQAAAKLPLHRGSVTSPPRGTLVYFRADTANRGFGHVGLSLGRGRMLSALAKVTITDVARSRYWRSLYLGWTDPPRVWPGRIPPPPGPTISDPGLTIRITAPAFGSPVFGTERVAAIATDASGVDFFSYYATNPLDAATRDWVHIGRGRLADDGSWVVDWDTTKIPDQGLGPWGGPWGIVNVAAVAMLHGKATATRDYRRFIVDNLTESPEGAVPLGALVLVTRVGAASALVTGWARDADDFAKPVTVTALVDGQPAGHAVANGLQTDVGPHGFSFQVATDAARHDVCIRATNIGPGWDAQIGKCMRIRRYGDVNDDGVVDCTDITLLEAAYGQMDGDADVNGDGKVDISDLSIVLSQYQGGTPCP